MARLPTLEPELEPGLELELEPELELELELGLEVQLELGLVLLQRVVAPLTVVATVVALRLLSPLRNPRLVAALERHRWVSPRKSGSSSTASLASPGGGMCCGRQCGRKSRRLRTCSSWHTCRHRRKRDVVMSPRQVATATVMATGGQEKAKSHRRPVR